MQNPQRGLRFGTMKIRHRWNKKDGFSLSAALLFFLFCSVCAAMLLSAAVSENGKAVRREPKDQKRFAVESAAQFLRDELMSAKNTVKIVEKYREEEESEISFYYIGPDGDPEDMSTWQEFPEHDGGILDSMIRAAYVPVSGEGADLPKAAEKKLNFSVKDTDGNELSELLVNVRICMEPDYKLTAIFTDAGSEQCTRRLTALAEVFTELEETGEETEAETEAEAEEGPEEGPEKDPETASDSDAELVDGAECTKITTIRWNNAVIEKEFLELWEMEETE